MRWDVGTGPACFERLPIITGVSNNDENKCHEWAPDFEKVLQVLANFISLCTVLGADHPIHCIRGFVGFEVPLKRPAWTAFVLLATCEEPATSGRL